MMTTALSRRIDRLTACGVLPVALLLLAATLAPGNADAQTAQYGMEEAERQEAEALAQEDDGAKVDVAPALIPGAASAIGSARTDVRGRGSRQSAMLRYDQHREIAPPDYATIRIGPLYSNLAISQSIGYRYIRLSGTGVDFLESGRRGDILKDGHEFPMVSSLTLNNYLIVTRKMDLEANINVSYYYYPMETQEDELRINLTDEGIFATLSTQFAPSRNSRVLVYDDILYRTDYIDNRGLGDRYGGVEYEHLQNTAGVDWDWKPTPLDSFSAAASRRDVYPFDKEFEQQKVASYSEMAAYRRSLTPFAAGGLLLSASQSFYDAEDRPDVYIYGASVFTGLRLTPRLTGDASLGYQFSSTDGSVSSDKRTANSWTASAGLEHEISEFYRQRLSWQRSLSEAFSGGVDVSDVIGYNLSWSGGHFPGSFSSTYSVFDPQDGSRGGYSDWTSSLSLQHQLTRLMKLSLNATYSMRMNEALDIADALPDLSSDYETLTLSASTGMKLTEKTTLSVYASHTERTSDNLDLVYTRDTVGVTLTWSHKF